MYSIYTSRLINDFIIVLRPLRASHSSEVVVCRTDDDFDDVIDPGKPASLLMAVLIVLDIVKLSRAAGY